MNKKNSTLSKEKKYIYIYTINIYTPLALHNIERAHTKKHLHETTHTRKNIKKKKLEQSAGPKTALDAFLCSRRHVRAGSRDARDASLANPFKVRRSSYSRS